jgi:hypothetical protein
LYQSISPGLRLFLWIFHNKDSFSQWGVVSPSPNPQAGGPPLVGCPRLLIQYIRSYPPCWRPFLHPQPGRAMPCWQGPTYQMDLDITAEGKLECYAKQCVLQ